METPAPAGKAVRKAIILATALVLLSAPASAQMGYYNSDGATAPADGGAYAPETSDEIDMSRESAAQEDPPEQSSPADSIPQTTQVTSLQKCLDRLSPEDAAEVRLNPIRPYQECLARLSNASAEKRKINVSRKKPEQEPMAENARNFSRVTEDDGDHKMDDAAKEAEADSGHWSAKPAPSANTLRAPIEPEGEPGGLPEESSDEFTSDDEDAKPARKSGLSRFIPEIKPDKSKARFNN